jgi:hypothetical protein
MLGGRVPKTCKLIDGKIKKLLGSDVQQDYHPIHQDHPENPLYVRFCIELKKVLRKLGLHEKGQAIGQALHLFRVQPNRTFVYAVLTNLKSIIYLKVEAKNGITPDPDRPDDFDYYESAEFDCGSDSAAQKNLQFLMYLLAADDGTVGLVPLPQFKQAGIEVNNFLARGATSSVFATEYQRSECVLKLPNKDHGDLFLLSFRFT